MTRDEIEAAGGVALDRLVAEHVMGWAVVVPEGADWDDRVERYPCVVVYPECLDFYKGAGSDGRFWSPTREANDWWSVVAAMLAKGWSFELTDALGYTGRTRPLSPAHPHIQVRETFLGWKAAFVLYDPIICGGVGDVTEDRHEATAREVGTAVARAALLAKLADSGVA